MTSRQTTSRGRSARRRGAGRLALAVAGLALVGLSAGSGVAQESHRDSHRIIQLEEEVVEGRIEKPEAFYILQPTNLNYESAELEESFVPELLRTVEEAPF